MFLMILQDVLRVAFLKLRNIELEKSSELYAKRKLRRRHVIDNSQEYKTSFWRLIAVSLGVRDKSKIN